MNQITIHPQPLLGMYSVHFNPFEDNRGSLFKYFTPHHFTEIDEAIVWRQVIIQNTEKANTIRGIHAQKPPFVESKLLVPLSGKMFWVCVDLRKKLCDIWPKQQYDFGCRASNWIICGTWFCPRLLFDDG